MIYVHHISYYIDSEDSLWLISLVTYWVFVGSYEGVHMQGKLLVI